MCRVIMACPQVSCQFNGCADILADVLFDQLSHLPESASLNTGGSFNLIHNNRIKSFSVWNLLNLSPQNHIFCHDLL